MHSKYSMVSVVLDRLLTNKLYSEKWLETHCQAVNKYFGKGHDEERLSKSQMPMMAEVVEVKPDETKAARSSCLARSGLLSDFFW